MPSPIRPDDISDELAKYFASLQVSPVQPDATRVAGRRPFRAPPSTNTIGAPGAKTPHELTGVLGAMLGAGEGFHNTAVGIGQRTALHRGYTAKDAASDIAGATGAKDVAEQLGRNNVLGALGTLAPMLMPGEGKFAKSAVEERLGQRSIGMDLAAARRQHNVWQELASEASLPSDARTFAAQQERSLRPLARTMREQRVAKYAGPDRRAPLAGQALVDHHAEWDRLSQDPSLPPSIRSVASDRAAQLLPDAKAARREVLDAANAKRPSFAVGDSVASVLPKFLGGKAEAPQGNPEILNILSGLRAGPQMPVVKKVDAEKAAHMAKVYESLPAFDPAAKPAYDALNSEVAKQFDALKNAGYKFDFVDHDPYKSSAEMMADVRDNKTLKVFKTGSDSFHPYMTSEQNDMFRAVHDAVAHAGQGHQFGPTGEENAFRVHASTLSPEAQRALATETRGQNSWVNFGPNAHLPAKERPFATQKAALWPEHLLGDYHEMPAPLPDKFAVLTGENPAGEAATPELNAARNQSLEQHLGEKGIKFTPVKGAYTDDKTGQLLHENSYLLHDIEPNEAERIARQFNQNGVVTHQGYHDLAGGQLSPSRGVNHGVTDAPYTELPGGHRFALDINWDAAQPLPSTKATPNVKVQQVSVPTFAPDPAPSAFPPQVDLPRHNAPRIPQSRLDDVEDEAFKTYTSPAFLDWAKKGNFADWYNTVGTRSKAIDALGEEDGPAAFKDLMQKMGATTARSRPDNNLRRASYYRALDLAGLLDPEALRAGVYKDVPKGMGHLANNAHHAALADLAENGQLNSITNPKPASFVDNLVGNFRPYTNDTRMAGGAAAVNPRLVDIGALVKSIGKDGGVTHSPRDWAYAPMERGFQRAADEHLNMGLLDVPSGASPTAFSQAKIWDGIGGSDAGNTGTFDDIFNRKLQDAASLWGVRPSEANSLFWQGNPFDLPLNTPLAPKKLVK